MALKRGNEDLGLVATVGVKRATSMLVKSACVMTLIEMEAADELERQQRALWWQQGLLKHAPDLSGRDYSNRGGLNSGQASNYGRNHTPPVSPKEFYHWFRFAREHIPHLVLALRIPAQFRTPSRCKCGGEEALLVFLRVTRPLSMLRLSMILFSCVSAQ